MKAKELRDKTTEELKKDFNEMKSKLSQMRFDVKARQTKNYREVRIFRRDIARTLTIIREKSQEKKAVKEK